MVWVGGGDVGALPGIKPYFPEINKWARRGCSGMHFKINPVTSGTCFLFPAMQALFGVELDVQLLGRCGGRHFSY